MYARRTSLLALAVSLGASATLAHGPTHQKLTETVGINAPAAKVWERIGNFQEMSWYHSAEKMSHSYRGSDQLKQGIEKGGS